jgi:hypothetical protein
MTDSRLYSQIESLSPELKKEVEDFVAFLKEKSKDKPVVKERKPGIAKGFFKMEADFDEPLEDFKDYM